MTYEEIRAKLAEFYGWSFREIDEMSWDQINSACRAGKRNDGIEINSIEDAIEIQKNWRAYAGL